MAPKLQDIADARVNFQPQSGGGFGRDITIMLGRDDPEQLEKTAHPIVQDLESIQKIRAPRVHRHLTRPDILVRPHMALAAVLIIPTAAPTQTHRLASLHDNRQTYPTF